MKIVMFVSNAASTAGKPDEVSNLLRLNIPPKSESVDDNNTNVFANPNQKNGFAEFNGITDELLAGFKAGQRVTVTIEVAK